MMWIALVHLDNSQNHLVRQAEFITLKKYSIDEFIADVNKAAGILCSNEKDLDRFQIINVILDRYVERFSV